MPNSTEETSTATSLHTWRFFRAGGVEQVMLRSGADIANIEHLDQKLWFALAMPTRGIEFDPRTLDLIDTDRDGRIRPPEVIAAVAWARRAFTELGGLLKGGESVPLTAIKEETIRKGTQTLLAGLGKKDAQAISLEDVDKAAVSIGQTPSHGEVAEDETKPKALAEVEKLVLFQRDLVKLLHNYVNFAEFYGLRWAIFQAGTLYLDTRSCNLCVEVADAGKHAKLAGRAGACLAYCECTRPGGLKKSVMAAFTDGDSDNLMVGRNGVFYDRTGLDWDARITQVVAHPISLREAFWLPYKRLAGAAQATATTGTDKNAPVLSKKRGLGTAAALGVAVGAIGVAIIGVAIGLVTLTWWQIPLVFVFIMLLMSLPSMLFAWMTLRRRSLAPILDANGWAINIHAKLNGPFGAALTQKAELPPNSERSTDDPFGEKKTPWAFGMVIVLILIVAFIVFDRSGKIHEWSGGWLGHEPMIKTNTLPNPALPSHANVIVEPPSTNAPAE